MHQDAFVFGSLSGGRPDWLVGCSQGRESDDRVVRGHGASLSAKPQRAHCEQSEYKTLSPDALARVWFSYGVGRIFEAVDITR